MLPNTQTLLKEETLTFLASICITRPLLSYGLLDLYM